MSSSPGKGKFESIIKYPDLSLLNFPDTLTLAQTSAQATPTLYDDPIVAAYKQLGIESIAEALRSMRFALGPRRKTLTVSLLIAFTFGKFVEITTI